jgi:hypothetical protein
MPTELAWLVVVWATALCLLLTWVFLNFGQMLKCMGELWSLERSWPQRHVVMDGSRGLQVMNLMASFHWRAVKVVSGEDGWL